MTLASGKKHKGKRNNLDKAYKITKKEKISVDKVAE